MAVTQETFAFFLHLFMFSISSFINKMFASKRKKEKFRLIGK